MKRRITKSERIANKLAEIVNDVSLDLDKVGYYLAEQPNISYNRLILIAEAAVEQKEAQDVRASHYPLF